MDPNKLYSELNSNICLSPFFQLFLVESETANISPCCMYKKNTVVTNAIKDAYNEEEYKTLRKMHYEGIGLEHPMCALCKDSEKSYNQSTRLINNMHLTQHFDVDWVNEIKRIADNGYEIDNVYIIDYVLGSYCNFACIICNKNTSTSRHLVENKIDGITESININENTIDINDIIDNVKLINFTGGEPLIHKKFLNFIDSVEQHLELKIDVLTNVSYYNESTFKKLEKFNECFMTLSIDGVGKYFEYQRRLGNWEKIEQNYKAIKANHPKITYKINFVVTAISLMGIIDFIRWLYENKEQNVAFTPVQDKEYLSINALDPIDIDNIKNALAEIRNTHIVKPSMKDFVKNVFDSLDEILNSYSFDPSLQDTMVKQMYKEDLYWKNISLTDIIPNLAKKYGK